MKVQTLLLIDNLKSNTFGVIDDFNNHFKNLSWQQLNWNPNDAKWSIAACFCHLNRYGNYYLPAIEQAIHLSKSKGYGFASEYKSGWLGEYFTKSMRPKADGSLAQQMNAPKGYNPTDSKIEEVEISKYEQQLYKMISLLEEAKTANLHKMKIPITINKWIKMSLGDTFRFNVAHIQRHNWQAKNVLEQLNLK